MQLTTLKNAPLQNLVVIGHTHTLEGAWLLGLVGHPHHSHALALHSNPNLITHALQANKYTRFYTLTNAGHLNNKPPENTIPEWVIKCTCSQPTCQCPAKLWPDVLCLIGAPNHTQTPIAPSPTITTQLIEFTFCYDRFPEQALTHKHNKYDPLITDEKQTPSLPSEQE